jgi:hypothetical protein
MVQEKAEVFSLQPQQTHLIKAKTRKGKRYLEKRGPKLVSHLPTLWSADVVACRSVHLQSLHHDTLHTYVCTRSRLQQQTSRIALVLLQVEDTKRALFLYGNDVSQTIKETMTDLHKLKGVSSSLFVRRS